MTDAEELELLELEEAARSGSPQGPKRPSYVGEDGRIDADALMQEQGFTPENITAGANNAAALMTGGLSKALPEALTAAKGIGGFAGRALTNIAEGASMGAAQSPQDRASGALMGGATQGALGVAGEGSSALRDWLSGASKQAGVNTAVRAGKSGEMLLGQADDAAGKLRGEISGHERELMDTLDPSGYEINPDMVAKTFPNYAKRLEKKLPMTERMGDLGETIQTQATQGRAPLSPEQTRRLWKASNKASQFSPSDIMNPVAKAKSESAEALGDSIRREVYGKTPQAQNVMEQMGQDIQAKNYLTGKAVQKNPQSALSSDRLGTKKMEALMDIDRRVGTDLAETGDRMATARNLYKPLELDVPSLGRAAKRAGYAAAPAVDGLAEFLGKTTSPVTAQTVRQGVTSATRVPGLTSEEQSEYDELTRLSAGSK